PMKITVNNLDIELELRKESANEFEVEVGGQKHRVKVLNISNDQIVFSIDHKIFTFNFSIDGDLTILTNSFGDYHCKVSTKYQSLIDSYRSTSSGEAKKEKILKSPMPGLVTKIFVKPGSQIKIGDKLLILEAMKMENEIRSDLEGIVEDVLVSEGSAVEKGASLLKISTN
ncbi:Biotin-requiring enzyme, partial [Candidatus Kryptonium thompsonii]